MDKITSWVTPFKIFSEVCYKYSSLTNRVKCDSRVIPRIMQKADYWMQFPSIEGEFEKERAKDCTHITRKGLPSTSSLATYSNS